MISLIISLSSNCFAQDSVYLEQSEKAPFAGYLLPADTLNTLRDNTLQLNTQKQINSSQESSLKYKSNIIEDLTSNNNVLTQRNKDLEDAVVKSQSSNELAHFLYFFGGVAATALAVWGASQLRK